MEIFYYILRTYPTKRILYYSDIHVIFNALIYVDQLSVVNPLTVSAFNIVSYFREAVL
jgi:hypothetical protein